MVKVVGVTPAAGRGVRLGLKSGSKEMVEVGARVALGNTKSISYWRRGRSLPRRDKAEPILINGRLPGEPPRPPWMKVIRV